MTTFQPTKNWKLYLWGRDTAALRDNLVRRGANVTGNADEADLIIPCGGDGTLFTAEVR